MKKTVYILIVALLLLVFGISAFLVGSYIVESREQAAKNAALAAQKDSAKETVPAQTEPEETVPEGTFSVAEIRDENGMLVEYAEIYAQNPDLVGWIRIDGTPLNNPVMQTPDRVDYYLYRNFKKESNSHGCLYVRESCDVFAPSDNVTIYGHHMKDGSMFAGLKKFRKQSFWEEYHTIDFDTLYERHSYTIFAVFTTTASIGEGFTYHLFEDAASEEEFNKFVSTCKSLALYDTGITPTYGDKMICLSTCEYSQENGRLVVVAVRN